jgi:hypothetical protein
MEYNTSSNLIPNLDDAALEAGLGYISGSLIQYISPKLINDKNQLSHINNFQEKFNRLGFTGIYSEDKKYIDTQNYKLALHLLALDIDCFDIPGTAEDMVKNMIKHDPTNKNIKKILENFNTIEQNFFEKNESLARTFNEYFFKNIYPKNIFNFVCENAKLIFEKIAEKFNSYISNTKSNNLLNGSAIYIIVLFLLHAL